MSPVGAGLVLAVCALAASAALWRLALELRQRFRAAIAQLASLAGRAR